MEMKTFFSHLKPLFISFVIIIFAAVYFLPAGTIRIFSGPKTQSATVYSPMTTGTYVPNEGVWTSVSGKNGDVYIGGDFTNIGEYSGHGIPVSVIDGKANTNFLKVNGGTAWNNQRNGVISDGNGGWFIFGQFSKIGDTNVNGLSHIRSDGTLDQNFHPTLSSSASRLEMWLSPDKQWIYNPIFSTNGYTGFAKINTSDGSVQNFSSFNMTGWLKITAMAMSQDGSSIYIARRTSNYTGIHGQIFAVSTLDGTTETFLANTNEQINNLTVSNDGKLYAYGIFTQIGTSGSLSDLSLFTAVARNGLASINLSTNTVTNFSSTVVSGGAVNAMKISPDNQTLYLAGPTNIIPLIGIDTNSGLLKFNPTITRSDWNGSVTVSSIAISPDSHTIFLIGVFGYVNGTQRNNAAAINVSSLEGYVTNFNPNLNRGGSSIALSSDGNSAYLTGNFFSVNPIETSIGHILSDGSLDKNFIFKTRQNGFTASVETLDISKDGSALYLGGYFTEVNGLARNHIASINVSNKTLTGLNPPVFTKAGASASSVGIIWWLKISPDNSTLYFDGDFDTVGGNSRSGLAAMNVSNNSISASFAPQTAIITNGYTNYARPYSIALSPLGDVLYVSGHFTYVNGISQKYLAGINTNNGSLVNTFKPVISNSLDSIVLSRGGSKIYVGGSNASLTVNGSVLKAVASINTSDGSLNTGFDLNISAFNSVSNYKTITALDISGDDTTLYVGGVFASPVVTGVNHLSPLIAVDAITGNILNFDYGLDDSVQTISVSNDDKSLFVGGYFHNINNYTKENPNFISFPSFNAPVVETVTSTPTLASSTLFGNIVSDGLSAIYEIGFTYGLHGQSLSSTTNATGTFDIGGFSLSISGLTCGTSYDFKAYAKNQYGQGNGEILTFNTVNCAVVIPAAPNVTNDDLLNVVYNMETGMEYSTDGVHWISYSPATFDQLDLSGNVTLYVRWKANGNIPASEIKTLTFTAQTIVECKNSFNQTWATLCGIINSEGSSDLIEVGFHYGLSEGDLDKTVSKTSGLNPGVFSLIISDLVCNTTYYYQGYAKNADGEGLGTIESFVTSACGSPLIEIPTVKIFGCTNKTATNYNSLANTDDGSCSNTPTNNGTILGCTDTNSSNYNPLANKDDGSCAGSSIGDNGDGDGDGNGGGNGNKNGTILGCTDTNSSNYNPLANKDDGSCSSFFDPIVESFEKAIDGLEKAIGGLLPEVFKDPLNNFSNNFVVSSIEKAIVAIGIVGGVSSALSFPRSFNLSDAGLIATRAFGLMLETLGIRKKRKQWGTVYDSETKLPLDPAYVSLISKETGKEVASAITDLDGRYGFLVNPGTYTIVVKKTDYAFPSKKMYGKENDEIYNQLYYGTELTVNSETDIITKNIPMDPVSFNWNEYAKRKANLNVFVKKYDVTIARVSRLFFDTGAIFSLVLLLVRPTTTNLGIFAVYIIIYLLNKYVVGIKRTGAIRDQNGPVAYAMIKIYRFGETDPIAKRVADAHGRYYTLVPKGDYQLEIDEKNLDGSYSEVYKSDIITAKNGIINKSLNYEKGFIS